MASISPLFDLTASFSANTATKDDWYDVASLSSVSNIPNGSQWLLGFLTFMSLDKQMTVEVRPNNVGSSSSGAANTYLLAFTSVDTSYPSSFVDMYNDGLIASYAPVTGSATASGEKLWLRVKSNTNTVASFNVILNYRVIT